MSESPSILVFAGPNGAGKTTIARETLPSVFRIAEFVNADSIAAGLAGFAPDGAAFAAGRLMLSRLDELATQRVSFAFESTLSSRTFAPWLRGRIADGYRVHIVYVMLRSPRLAVQRVSQRVTLGGHDVPADIVKRRFWRSAANFMALYAPLADTWGVFDNSNHSHVRVAQLTPEGSLVVERRALWRRFCVQARR
ncbi:MAG: zeta toxin family protein [Phycisphaerales bacterium]|jgi:predicted ABC-type ATPase|nr:zeta toxin family protein [Phycisphaeraceae bacterium]